MSSDQPTPVGIGYPAQQAPAWFGPDRPALEWAILQTVAYADVFDYPLTAAEVHRYLVGVSASPGATEAALRNGGLVPRYLTHQAGYFTLPGREASVAVRQRRAAAAERLWPRAARYGRAIASLPFVRLVAVTGALAVNNAESDDDIDYLIVTAPDRLWLCRLLVIVLVKLVGRRPDGLGDFICPNYFLSEGALSLPERNLFSAHEVTQMVPLAGAATYHRLRRLNAWTADFLPNAAGPPKPVFNGRPKVQSPRSRVQSQPGYGGLSTGDACVTPPDLGLGTRDSRGPVRRLTEAALRTPVGGQLERWEMARKVRKFSQWPNDHAEAAFGAEWCKGHFDGHGRRVLAAYADRLRALEELAR